MTSLNKKRKCKHSFFDRGGEKCKCIKFKRVAIFHKKDRVRNKKACQELD